MQYQWQGWKSLEAGSLDSQSYLDRFTNKKLLKNIQDTNKPLILHSNAVVMTVNKIATSWDNGQYGSIMKVLLTHYLLIA